MCVRDEIDEDGAIIFILLLEGVSSLAFVASLRICPIPFAFARLQFFCMFVYLPHFYVLFVIYIAGLLPLSEIAVLQL